MNLSRPSRQRMRSAAQEEARGEQSKVWDWVGCEVKSWGDKAYKEWRTVNPVGAGLLPCRFPSHSEEGGEFGEGHRDSAGLGVWRLDRETK